ncbi:MAG: Lrp/AsnC family transcriptional regulator [Candidatus Diapherotrites archaeon]
MAELDLKDRMIIFELDKNSRQSLKSVSRKVGVSREVVDYRLGNMLREGIIRKFLAVIDVSKLGFTHHKVYVRLQNIDEEKSRLLLNKIMLNPFVTWVAFADGAYSLIFAVKSRNLVELNKILREIESDFGQYFMEYDIAGIIQGIHFERNYLVPKKAEFKEVSWGSAVKIEEIDETDKIILHHLGRDARARAVDIAKEADCSPDSVAQRIRGMEDAGLVEKYMVFTDNIKMGQLYYKVLVGLKPLSEEVEKKLVDYCSAHPNIVYIVKALGRWNLELDIEVEDVNKFREVMRDFSSKFSKSIKDYSALNIYNDFKFTFFEKEMFD